MSSEKVRPYIEKYYPKYYKWCNYPKDDCISFLHVSDEYGIFSNFGNTPIIVNGITFKNVEQLFHILKFTDAESINLLYHSNGLILKRIALQRENLGLRRTDWGMIIIDVMKCCLLLKYNQCALFREKLNQSKNFVIVEEAPKNKKNADTWNAKNTGSCFEGSNLMGRLLMELRDNGTLVYNLPDNIFDSLEILSQ